MPLSLKEGVTASKVHPKILEALVKVEAVYRDMGIEDTVITSISNGKHKPGSLHGRGRAFDLRTKWTGIDPSDLLTRVADALGPDYDVILEDKGGDREHVHCEWDPK